MLLEIVLLVIALWFVFGAGFWGLIFQIGLRFEPRRRAMPPRTGGGLPVAPGPVGTTFARAAERERLPPRNTPLTWA